MNNVFVVETPLQMLNAIEAKYSLCFSDTTLLVILSESFPDGVFRPLLDFADWDRIEYLAITHRHSYLNLAFLGDSCSNRINEYIKELRQLTRRQRFELLIKRLGKIDNLILGNYLGGYMRHLANMSKAKKIYLVDDGTDALRVNDMRAKQEASPVASQLSLARRIKNNIRDRFVGWDHRQVGSVTFFSSYDLAVKEGDCLVKNDYHFFRSMLRNSRHVDEIYFLGQPLVEDGYLSQEEYRSYLSRINEYYQGHKLVYVPHKRESLQLINKIEEMEIPVRSFNLPIELQMLQGDIPSELASFFCSALDNCRRIFGDILSIKAFRIDQKDLNPGCEFVEGIYDYFSGQASSKFGVLPL